MGLHLVSQYPMNSVERSIFERLMTFRKDLLVRVEPDTLFALIDEAATAARLMGAGEPQVDIDEAVEREVEAEVGQLTDDLKTDLTTVASDLEDVLSTVTEVLERLG